MAEQIVFVVARDPALRRALARALSGAPGLQAVTMSGGASIVSLARSCRPAAIVAEPEPGLLARLREHAETRDIPLVPLAPARDVSPAPPAPAPGESTVAPAPGESTVAPAPGESIVPPARTPDESTVPPAPASPAAVAASVRQAIAAAASSGAPT
jgi:hypothetical protein